MQTFFSSTLHLPMKQHLYSNPTNETPVSDTQRDRGAHLKTYLLYWSHPLTEKVVKVPPFPLKDFQWLLLFPGVQSQHMNPSWTCSRCPLKQNCCITEFLILCYWYLCQTMTTKAWHEMPIDFHISKYQKISKRGRSDNTPAKVLASHVGRRVQSPALHIFPQVPQEWPWTQSQEKVLNSTGDGLKTSK